MLSVLLLGLLDHLLLAINLLLPQSCPIGSLLAINLLGQLDRAAFPALLGVMLAAGTMVPAQPKPRSLGPHSCRQHKPTVTRF